MPHLQFRCFLQHFYDGHGGGEAESKSNQGCRRKVDLKSMADAQPCGNGQSSNTQQNPRTALRDCSAPHFLANKGPDIQLQADGEEHQRDTQRSQLIQQGRRFLPECIQSKTCDKKSNQGRET